MTAIVIENGYDYLLAIFDAETVIVKGVENGNAIQKR